MKLVNISHCR